MGYTYLVGWDDTADIKVGISGTPARWQPFLRRGATLYSAFHTSGTGHGALEQRLLAWLRDSDYVSPAFHYRQQGHRQLGRGGNGYTECFHANCLAFYRYALASCSSIMREHAAAHSSDGMRPLMHGRTDARTYVEPNTNSAYLTSVTRAGGAEE